MDDQKLGVHMSLRRKQGVSSSDTSSRISVSADRATRYNANSY